MYCSSSSSSSRSRSGSSSSSSSSSSRRRSRSGSSSISLSLSLSLSAQQPILASETHGVNHRRLRSQPNGPGTTKPLTKWPGKVAREPKNIFFLSSRAPFLLQFLDYNMLAQISIQHGLNMASFSSNTNGRYRSAGVPVHRCTGVPLCRCIGVTVYQRIGVPVYH